MRESINSNTILELSKRIKGAYTEFKQEDFVASITPFTSDLGLFERLDLTTKGLYKFLPKEFKTAVNILLKSLGSQLPSDINDLDGRELGSNNGFIVVALTNYVSDYGLDEFEISMNALYLMTKMFTSEGSIRHFIKKYPNKCYDKFKQWIHDDNVHVRRLVSESLRPRLPWAIRLQMYIENPEPILFFLEALKNDKHLYVRRSVANNLNDIAKDNPKVVVNLLKRWNKDKSNSMQWLVKHSLRTLIKEGNTDALEIMGFSKNPSINVTNFSNSKTLELGDFLGFSLDIESTTSLDQKLVIDFIIHHVKYNGKLTPKVFKLKNLVLKGHDKVTISKKHSIKPISTRTYYSGIHKITIQINGQEFAVGEFTLSV